MSSGLADLLSNLLGDQWVDMSVLAVCFFLGAVVIYVGARALLNGPKKWLDVSHDFQAYPLVDKVELSHDTRKFTFAIPAKGYVLGLPIGQHMTLKFTNADGKAVQRSYTPVSDNHTLDIISFVIKVYKAHVHPKFPDGGQMSQHLDALQIGDTILMKGPKGHMEYHANGTFQVKPLGKPLQHRQCDAIGMMAGGTGITPMLQILHAIFDNPNDTTRVALLYANQTPDDILVRDELEALAKKYPQRFRLHYTVDQVAPAQNWKYSQGFIDQDKIEQHVLVPGAKKQQFFLCGPPPMIKFACVPNLQTLGYQEQDWVVF